MITVPYVPTPRPPLRATFPLPSLTFEAPCPCGELATWRQERRTDGSTVLVDITCACRMATAVPL